MKDDKVYSFKFKLFGFFSHLTRFSMLAPGPVQLTSAYVMFCLHNFVYKFRKISNIAYDSGINK